jgi:hypothetical protein
MQQKSNICKFFEELFTNYKEIPLIPSQYDMTSYINFIKVCNKNTLKVKYNPSLIYLSNHTIYDETKQIPLYWLENGFVYFILNAFKFATPLLNDNNKRNLIAKWLGIGKYYDENCFYGSKIINDCRLSYKLYNLLMNGYMDYYRYNALIGDLNLPENYYYIENLYYLNRFNKLNANKKTILLKSMKVKIEMNSIKCNNFNEFVNINMFNNLINIMKKIANKFYITGSIIDYINNTRLIRNNYNDSDIDIVITDKKAFELLAGYIKGYLEFVLDITDGIEYTGKHINIKADIFSTRPIQIYYMDDKHYVFTHHFPCVRGYINNKLNMYLSQQAVKIFEPSSDKKIKFIFMFPYTDVAKARAIISKYKQRGYYIE